MGRNDFVRVTCLEGILCADPDLDVLIKSHWLCGEFCHHQVVWGKVVLLRVSLRERLNCDCFGLRFLQEETTD